MGERGCMQTGWWDPWTGTVIGHLEGKKVEWITDHMKQHVLYCKSNLLCNHFWTYNKHVKYTLYILKLCVCLCMQLCMDVCMQAYMRACACVCATHHRINLRRSPAEWCSVCLGPRLQCHSAHHSWWQTHSLVTLSPIHDWHTHSLILLSPATDWHKYTNVKFWGINYSTWLRE